MPDSSSRGRTEPVKPPSESAVAQIVHMNPRRITVELPLPIPNVTGRPSIRLEWDREDTTMPLSELLQRIEAFTREFGAK